MNIAATVWRTRQEIDAALAFLAQTDKYVASCSGCPLFRYRIERSGGNCMLTGEWMSKGPCFFERDSRCPFPSVGGDESWRGDKTVALFGPKTEVLVRGGRDDGKIEVTTSRLIPVTCARK